MDTRDRRLDIYGPLPVNRGKKDLSTVYLLVRMLCERLDKESARRDEILDRLGDDISCCTQKLDDVKKIIHELLDVVESGVDVKRVFD